MITTERKGEAGPSGSTNEDDRPITPSNAKQPEVKIPYKRLFAGAVAGIADVWACHGLDRIKTHMQQHHGQTIVSSARQIMQKGGIFALYEGIMPMTLEAIVKVGLRYFSFSYFQEQWRVHVQKLSDSHAPINVWGNAISGALAGAVESFVIVIPCELLKVRHMTQTNHESFFTVFRNVLRDEGPAALYKGGTATLLRQLTNAMIRFPVFYSITESVKEWRGEKHLPAIVNLSTGAFAGMVSTLINTPLDTIKTRHQKHGQQEGVLGVIRGIYRDGGLRTFWSGTWPRVVRVAPGQAITWAVYEKVVEFIGKD